MRASFVFSEVLTGLRRNVTMTIAMVLTTMISLALLGGGLLVVRMIDKMQVLYSDKVEVAVYLTKDISANDKACAQEPCKGLRSNIESNPAVDSVVYEDQDAAYARFQQIFEAQPELRKLTRPGSLPASFRIKLVDPERSEVIPQTYSGKPGVDSVDDQGVFLERFFGVLNGIRNGVFAMAMIAAVAALLLIANTIQLSAFTRRTEVEIMRLVGATRWYTQLPFLLEAVVAGIAGALGAAGLLVLAKLTFLDKVLAGPIQANILPAVEAGDLVAVSFILVPIAIVVSALTGYVTLRLYVRT